MERLRCKLVFAIIVIALGAQHTRAVAYFDHSRGLPQIIAAASDGQATKPKKAKKAKAKKGGGVSFYEGSGETRAERDKRLSRECKGRPNSGLCEGYTR
jgi:hypothetical protein